MLFSMFSMKDWEEAAERMRRVHSEWLTGAMKHGKRPPRIPVRKVSEGGWSAMMETEAGRAWAEEFWQGALEHPDAG